MRILMMLTVLFALVFGCGLSAQETAQPVPAEAKNAPELQARIDALIKQLGSEDWKIRDAAAKELIEIGKPALRALQEAVKNEDPEIKNKARFIIEEIDLRLMLEWLVKNWGTKWYNYSRPENKSKMGFVRISVAESTYKEERVIVLEVEMAINWRGEFMEQKYTIYCRRNVYLSPLYINCKGKGAEAVNWSAEIKEGKAMITRAGKKREQNVPHDGIITFAQFILVTIRPFKEGVVLPFTSLEVEGNFNIKPGHEMGFDGKEEIIRDKKNIPAYKFALLNKLGKKTVCWVTEDRELIRVAGDCELNLTTEADARDGIIVPGAEEKE